MNLITEELYLGVGEQVVQCECNCGRFRPMFDKKGRRRTQIWGHVNRGKPGLRGSANHFFGKHMVPWNKGKRGIYSDQTLRKMVINRKTVRGPLHTKWAGDNVKNGSLHSWLKKNWPDPKPNKCEICDLGFCSLELCNIAIRRNKQTYNRDFKNWFWACHSCHMMYDGRRFFIKTGVVTRDSKTGQFRRGSCALG